MGTTAPSQTDGRGSFAFDVFLSHSSHDKPVVRELAERLKADGLSVWWDEWEIGPGASIPGKLAEGLENSRVLLMLLSENFNQSDWVRYEGSVFTFRDPANAELRFIPVRLDDSDVRPTLAHYHWVDWRADHRSQQNYQKLLTACRGEAELEPVVTSEDAAMHEESETQAADSQASLEIEFELLHTLKHPCDVNCVTFSDDGKFAFTGADDRKIRVWDLATGECTATLEGHLSSVWSVALTPDGTRAVSGSNDKTVRVWNLAASECTATLEGHSSSVRSVALTPDGTRAVSGSQDNTVRVWDLATGECTATLEGHSSSVRSVALTPDGTRAVSGSYDETVRVWDLATGECTATLEGHSSDAYSVALTPDGTRAASGSVDNTVRVWDLATGECTATLEGHTASVLSVVLTPDGTRAVSGSLDSTVRVWDLATGECTTTLEAHEERVYGVDWSKDTRLIGSASWDNTVKIWEVKTAQEEKYTSSRRPSEQDNRGGGRERAASEEAGKLRAPSIESPRPPTRPTKSKRYTNAKVLLVGESGVGKTGLARRMATNEFEKTESTDGHWATRLEAAHVDEEWATRLLLDEQLTDDGTRREIWLWDFAGQADYRLIHQLFMDETSLAVLVFNPQQEDLFHALSRWDTDIARAAKKEYRKLLVAGRIDVGRLAMPKSDLDRFLEDRGFDGYLETSAKTGAGCKDLVKAICETVDWDRLTKTVSTATFDRLKTEILKLRDQASGGTQDAGQSVLIRLGELNQRLLLTVTDLSYSYDELTTVVGHLASPGLVWKLDFGGFVLLQPERINSYAAAAVRELRSRHNQLGIIAEDDVLAGQLDFGGMNRLPPDDERIVLQAMHQTFVDRGLCIRQVTDTGTKLVFPAFFGADPPLDPDPPPLFVRYDFTGFLDDIYATLVVRLHHTTAFERQHLWRDYAEFLSETGSRISLKLMRGREDKGSLSVFMDASTLEDTRVIFSRYVHEHLAEKAEDIERARQYVCTGCGHPIGDLGAVKAALAEKQQEAAVRCSRLECGAVIHLWDQIERKFSSDEFRERVRQLQNESKAAIAADSTEIALLRHADAIALEASQVFRKFDKPDQGLYGEIVFREYSGDVGEHKVLLHIDKRWGSGEDFTDGDMVKREKAVDGDWLAARASKCEWLEAWQDSEHMVMWVYRDSQRKIWWFDPRERNRHEEVTAAKLMRLRAELLGPPPAMQ